MARDPRFHGQAPSDPLGAERPVFDDGDEVNDAALTGVGRVSLSTFLLVLIVLAAAIVGLIYFTVAR